MMTKVHGFVPGALRIRNTNFIFLDEGAYGIVFVDGESKRIRKVMKRRYDLSMEHIAAVFDAEVRAYEIATSEAELRQYVPDFFGHCAAGVIVDHTGNDVSQTFLLDYAFEAEFIDGKFIKSGLVGDQLHHVIGLFKKNGIRHLIDMSVCFYEDGSVRKVIDFATEQYETDWLD
jgi:hypothetical protein